MSAAVLLDRLEGARATGPGRWVARCPAHVDRGPSLSVRDAGDGRTLVHCFAGCDVADVLAAVGATWDDLFPPRSRNDAPQRRHRERVASAEQALKCLAVESQIVAIIGGDLARGVALSDSDRQRLLLAVGRINSARDLCDER